MTMEKQFELTLKLNALVTEYLALEREKDIYYNSHIKDKSRTTIQTLYLQQAYIDTTIKRIIMIVGRLNRHNVDYDNDVADMLYNEYEPLIKRGFNPFI